VTLRLGYFPNVTHATAIVGVEGGFFQKALGTDKLKTSLFNAGPAATEALFSGALDATYIGPNPTINAYAQSNGSAVRIISGATSGGALLVVKPDITSAADLKGKKVATPQLGNTQDVALRYWLSTQGLKTDTSGGGDVSVVPQDNSTTLQTFKQGAISGAWVPEPYATRMVQAGGKVLVDERSLWPNGQFVTTQLIVRTQFLKDHPDVVRELIEGQVAANDFMAGHPGDAQQMVDAGIAKVTGTDVGLATVASAWANMTFTNDPIASSLNRSAQHATALGLLQPVDLKGIYDLTILNQVLAAHSLQAVNGL
jgi:NitT/TauT family transport system substrate-binding protein